MEVILPQVMSNVPAFLTKLWKMVDDPETSHLISWGDEGNSFVIHNQGEFAASLLPYYYKHSNMASFVRQLNMYGFHKVVGVDSGGLKSERVEEMEFAHPCFLRGHEHLLESIKRKASNRSGVGAASGASGGANFAPALQADRVNEVLNEVSQLKDKQEDMDGKLETMKKENEALWREVVNLRQKHLSQQKIVNKLIQFLVSFVQPRISSAGGAVKRRYQPQLAIEDNGLPREAKEQKRDLLQTALQGVDFGAVSGGSSDPSKTTATFTLGPDNSITSGPVIRDVTHDISEGMSYATAPSMVEQPKTPAGSSALLAVDPKLVTPTIVVNSGTQNVTQPSTNQLKSPKRPVLNREMSREDMDIDIHTFQKDLDHLKDMMSNHVTVDSSLISNLFSPEEPLSTVFAGSSSNADFLNSLNPAAGLSKLPIGMETNDSTNAAAGASPSRLSIPGDDASSFGLTSPSRQPGIDDQPSLFELTDFDGDDLNTPLVESVTTPGSSKPTIKTNLVPANNDDMSSLNTPVVYGDYQDSPFMKSLRNKKK